jgi:putative FmdB family regulatory protein
MPTYDYRCEKDHVFELFHSIKDDSPKACPKCGTPSKRVPSGGSGLLFKGSGFYITENRSKHYKERANAEKSSGAASSASSAASGSGASGSSGSAASSKPSSGGKE